MQTINTWALCHLLDMLGESQLEKSGVGLKNKATDKSERRFLEDCINQTRIQ